MSLQLTIAEAIAAKRLGWAHEGQPVKSFRLTDMVRGQKTARATQLGVKTCRQCGLFMVDSAAANCGGCLAKKREARMHVKTVANAHVEEKAAAGSTTAFHINKLKAEQDAVKEGCGFVAPQDLAAAERRGFDVMRQEAMDEERARIAEEQRLARSWMWLGNAFNLWRPTFTPEHEALITAAGNAVFDPTPAIGELSALHAPPPEPRSGGVSSSASGGGALQLSGGSSCTPRLPSPAAVA